MKTPSIVITGDRTVMNSNYGIFYLDKYSYFPRKDIIPSSIFSWLSCPKIETNGIEAKYAPYRLRKVEASLLDYGFSDEDIVVTPLWKLTKVITDKTKVILIGASTDPRTGFLEQIIGKESYRKEEFRKFLTNSLFEKYKLTKIVFGVHNSQGVYSQLPEVDTVVIGEVEQCIPPLVEKAIGKDDLPKIVKGHSFKVIDIPTIKNPTIGGFVEVARGCGLNCSFCTEREEYQSLPLQKILEEVKVNLSANSDMILFHATDNLRYGSNINIQPERVIELLKQTKSLGARNIYFVHTCVSSVLQAPRLISDITETLEIGSKQRPIFPIQVGIETGSSKLASRHIRGKIYPYSPDNWKELIMNAFGLMNDNNWMPYGNIILGLPGETMKDIEETKSLIEDLKNYRSLITTTPFVSYGNNKTNTISKEHMEIIKMCMNHSLRNISFLYKNDQQAIKWLPVFKLPSFFYKNFVSLLYHEFF